MGNYQRYFRKLDIFFSGKQQGAIRTELKLLLLYHVYTGVTIFKVAKSLSIFSTTRPSLAEMKCDYIFL